MIVTLNLSYPRKTMESLLNNLVFELKMKDVNLKNYSNTALCLFLLLAFKQSEASASELALPKELSDIYEITAIPVTYTAFELYKMKDHLLLYGYLKFKGLQKFFR